MYLKKSTELSEGKDVTKKLKNSMEKTLHSRLHMNKQKITELNERSDELHRMYPVGKDMENKKGGLRHGRQKEDCLNILFQEFQKTRAEKTKNRPYLKK